MQTVLDFDAKVTKGPGLASGITRNVTENEAVSRAWTHHPRPRHHGSLSSDYRLFSLMLAEFSGCGEVP